MGSAYVRILCVRGPLCKDSLREGSLSDPYVRVLDVGHPYVWTLYESILYVEAPQVRILCVGHLHVSILYLERPYVLILYLGAPLRKDFLFMGCLCKNSLCGGPLK